MGYLLGDLSLEEERVRTLLNRVDLPSWVWIASLFLLNGAVCIKASAHGFDPDYLSYPKPQITAKEQRDLKISKDFETVDNELSKLKFEIDRNIGFHIGLSLSFRWALDRFIRLSTRQDSSQYEKEYSLLVLKNFIARLKQVHPDNYTLIKVKTAAEVDEYVEKYVYPKSLNALSDLMGLNATDPNLFVADGEDQKMIILLGATGEAEDRIKQYREFKNVTRVTTDIIRRTILNLGISLTGQSQKFKFQDASLQRMVEISMQKYFPLIDSTTVDLMVEDTFASPGATSSPDILFGVIAAHLDPIFLKLCQMLAREPGVDPEFAKVLSRTEQNMTVRRESELTRSIRKQSYLGLEENLLLGARLNAGSMAATYMAEGTTVGSDSKKLVVRALKPGIEESFLAGKTRMQEIIRLVASDTFLNSKGRNSKKYIYFLKSMITLVELELTSDQTAERQLNARSLLPEVRSIQTPHGPIQVEIKVPMAYPSIKKSTSFAQDFEEGLSFDEFVQTSHRYKPQAIMQAIVQNWLKEGFLGSGFIHGDLHPGQIRIREITDSQYVVPIFDYGITHEISKRHRQDLLLLSIGAELRDLKIIELALSSSSTVKLGNEFILKMKTAPESLKTPLDWLEWGLDQGLDFDISLFIVARTERMLKNLLAYVDSKEEMIDVFLQLADEDTFRARVLELKDRLGLPETLRLVSQCNAHPKLNTLPEKIFRNLLGGPFGGAFSMIGALFGNSKPESCENSLGKGPQN